MQFSTKVPISKYKNPITYESRIMLIGSCFTNNIGEKLEYFKFQNSVNPFGIIFNPVSIEKILNRVINKIKFKENDIFFHNEQWHCFEVHSELSNSNKDEFLKILNNLLIDCRVKISKLTHFIITYGTSWVYRNLTSNEIVANCHKVPQKEFTKELLSIEIISKSIENTVLLIRKINPDCNFIFTISPVRHIKDGFIENQVSKSHLISAVYSSNLLPTTYFASYEIMMDELRDYRFYANDMLHPSQLAIDYIWIKFFENYVAESEFETMNVVCGIQKSLKHKPFNPESQKHLAFLADLNLKIDKIRTKYPFMEF